MEASTMKNEFLPMKKRKLRYIEEGTSSSQQNSEETLATRKSSGAPKAKYPRHRSTACPADSSSPQTSDKDEDYPKTGEFEIVITREEQVKTQNLYCRLLLKEMFPDGHDFEVADHFLVERIEIPADLPSSSEAEKPSTSTKGL